MTDGNRQLSQEPVKLYFRIGEVSQIVGVQPHVLRYWESEFRTIRPQKSPKGQRVYSRSDVERLLRVKDLLKNQGFTISGARKQLHTKSAAGGLPSRSLLSGAPQVDSAAVAASPLGGATPSALAARASPADAGSAAPVEASATPAAPPTSLAAQVVLAPVAQALSATLEPDAVVFRSAEAVRTFEAPLPGPILPRPVLPSPVLPAPVLPRPVLPRSVLASDPGPSAKSLRRRLVEIRAELLEMLGELDAAPPCEVRGFDA